MFNIFNSMGWLLNGKTPNMNILTANDIYDRLKLIAVSMFEWHDLPETLNARHLENTLFLYGRALFFFDEELGILNSRCTPSGQLNFYDEPVSYTAYSTIYSKIYNRDESVLVRNNYLERPTDVTVMMYASRLTEIQRTIDVNLNAQKTPVMVWVDEKNRLTMLNLYKQYEGNTPFIMGGKSLSSEGIKVLKTEAPYVIDKLQIYKQQLNDEILTFFGVNNANSEKRERLITDEVNANNEAISINAESMLLTRQEACDAFNKKYGYNISVSMRTDDPMATNNDLTKLLEGEEE